MWLKTIVVLFLLLVGGLAARQYVDRQNDITATRAANWGQNFAIYARQAAVYAERNPTVVKNPSDTELALPTWYKKLAAFNAYVDHGNAYVYLAAGGTREPLMLLRDAGAPGRTLGIKAGTVAKDATGTTVAGAVIPLPAAIPDGAAVMVARAALPPPPPPPASPTAQQPATPPPLYNPGKPLPPPIPSGPPIVSNPVNFPPPVTPPVPIPPAEPVQPPVPVLPPAITSFTIGIHGGYNSGDGPKPGMKTCTGPTFNTFVLWDVGQGNPADFYVISMSRNGQTVSKTLQNNQIQCAAACAGNGSLMTAAQAIAFTPDINWSKLVYDHTVQVGSGITIYDWMMNMTVTLQSCNGNGCSSTTETAANLGIFSNGQHDCTGGGSYPATAHP
jgi:hypothetical protein